MAATVEALADQRARQWEIEQRLRDAQQVGKFAMAAEAEIVC